MARQFDAYRRLGTEALRFSREWLTKPSRTAKRFTELAYWSSFGADVNVIPEGMMQSLLVNALVAGRWAMAGFPTVTMGHKTAAALCATKMRAEDAVAFVRPPWPAFCIRLPNGLLTINEDGTLRDAELLFVAAVDPVEWAAQGEVRETHPQPADQCRWWYKLVAESPLRRPTWLPSQYSGLFDSISLWGFNQATQYLAAPDGGEEELGFTRWDTIQTQDSDKRTEQLMRAMILSTCMYLSGDPRELATQRKEGGIQVKERKSKQRDGDEFPQYTIFELTSAVTVNMTEPIRTFIQHGGSAPSVQTYVQGHWKRVPYGPGGAQRKLTHIQPYWRGELNAPVSSRTSK